MEVLNLEQIKPKRSNLEANGLWIHKRPTHWDDQREEIPQTWPPPTHTIGCCDQVELGTVLYSTFMESSMNIMVMFVQLQFVLFKVY